jgi:glycosyltransferase involved in cell wall biosynthesis
MKIAVDGFEWNHSFTGVGRYLYNLLQALLPIDKENHYTLFLREPPAREFSAANLTIRVLPTGKSHTRWQNSDLIRALNQGNFDLFFSPNHSIPLRYKGRSFLTLHDVSWKTMRGDYSWKERRVRDIKTRISFKKAELIFTVSEFSKEETITYYHVDPAKVKAIHSGVEPCFAMSPPETLREFREKYRLGEAPVIGYLGSMFRRRHLAESLQAFNLLRQEKDVRFFLVGKNYYGGQLEGLLRSPGVTWLERIDEAEINAFYSCLDVLLYLSAYEGFGFPPMEALQCGTISLLLETSSLKEVFKDLAVFIAAPEPRRIKEELLSILDAKALLKEQILDRYRERGDYFSWSRAAREYRAFFV